MKVLFFIIPFFSLFAQVEAPNYNFSIDEFEKFRPGTTIEQVKQAYPKIELIKDDKELPLYKLLVSYQRYVFPVFLQVNNNQVIDFFARLPSYFLHDVFHQALINKYQKQDNYLLFDEQAVYQWKDRNNSKIVV